MGLVVWAGHLSRVKLKQQRGFEGGKGRDLIDFDCLSGNVANNL